MSIENKQYGRLINNRGYVRTKSRHNWNYLCGEDFINDKAACHKRSPGGALVAVRGVSGVFPHSQFGGLQ